MMKTLTAAEVLAGPLSEDAEIVLATGPTTAADARADSLMPWMAAAWRDDWGGPSDPDGALDALAEAVVTPYWEVYL